MKPNVSVPANRVQMNDEIIYDEFALPLAIATNSYQAAQEDELSLLKGDRVVIFEKLEDGWWRGKCGDKEGWFPSNFVQEEIKSPSLSVAESDTSSHIYESLELPTRASPPPGATKLGRPFGIAKDWITSKWRALSKRTKFGVIAVGIILGISVLIAIIVPIAVNSPSPTTTTTTTTTTTPTTTDRM